jgi:hypothetical protein
MMLRTLYARILSLSLTSVSIFSVCCYSIVSISMVRSPLPLAGRSFLSFDLLLSFIQSFSILPSLLHNKNGKGDGDMGKEMEMIRKIEIFRYK